MTTTTKSTIAVLGATGDCAGWALATALTKGHSCRALARNPEKLVDLMTARGVPQDFLDRNLVIVKGNAKNKDEVKNLLREAEHKVVDRVLFGVGGKPSLAFTWSLFTIDDPTVCGSSMAALLAALSELAQESTTATRPQVTAISTTGITHGPRDVPILLVPLYHWLLAKPHVDKHQMEDLLRSASSQANPNQTGLSSASIVRPTLLVDGPGTGLGGVKAGTESHPALGYTIARKDVGLWIYENLLVDKDTVWKGESASLTY
ncbi:hypothetical protein K461DRAFT_309037 [Myriangium duriaei CBS 260.36]|uniref:NAD(P)-binding domain-containing protein n=1 Tax=Myriangium duriaei CBS 260.36 TaxID=1168546 RepID=A0A9P4MRP8_9PEZI|nr:hypothetical protein K461DRAFT_309037 [Myriangium duriaei CBS 260.36]